MRFRARVEYDGTDFFGFQVQARGRTVQGELERAIQAVTGHQIRVTAAGRTDRGVHAQGQVIAFEVPWRHSLADLRRALNATLAEDVALCSLEEAAEDFHPRFSAVSRVYRYTLLNRPVRSPLHRRRAWQVWPRLDRARMAEASRHLIGEHDFATFGRPPQGENTVRRVLRAGWEEAAPFLHFEIEANAFLYRMVRTIVGALVQVGWGQVSPAAFAELLPARDRSLIKLVAPPQGLCLMQVNYKELDK